MTDFLLMVLLLGFILWGFYYVSVQWNAPTVPTYLSLGSTILCLVALLLMFAKVTLGK